MKAKKTLIKVLGGTLLMKPSADGLVSMHKDEAAAVLRQHGIKDVDIEFAATLLDSSDLTQEHFITEYEYLLEKAEAYDSVIYLTGTDTLTYFIAFLNAITLLSADPHEMRRRQKVLDKLVLTASMEPFTFPGSDAPGNVLAAIAAAQSKKFGSGVYLAMNRGQVHFGNLIRKIHTSTDYAFASRHGPLKSYEGLAGLDLAPLQREPGCFEVIELHKDFHLPTFKDILEVVDGVVFTLGEGWEKAVRNPEFQALVEEQRQKRKFANTQVESLENALAFLAVSHILGVTDLASRQSFLNKQCLGPPLPVELTEEGSLDKAGKALLQSYMVTPYGSPRAFDIVKERSEHLLIKAFGMGNGPQWLLHHLERQRKDQSVSPDTQLYMTSQCPKGDVNLEEYAAGRRYLHAGVRATQCRNQRELAIALGLDQGQLKKVANL